MIIKEVREMLNRKRNFQVRVYLDKILRSHQNYRHYNDKMDLIFKKYSNFLDAANRPESDKMKHVYVEFLRGQFLFKCSICDMKVMIFIKIWLKFLDWEWFSYVQTMFTWWTCGPPRWMVFECKFCHHESRDLINIRINTAPNALNASASSYVLMNRLDYIQQQRNKKNDTQGYIMSNHINVPHNWLISVI